MRARNLRCMASRSITPKQAAFVQEYLVDLNATQAAIRAGYSAKTAEQAGSRALRIVQVADAITAAKAEREKRTEITQDRVLRELALIGFANMQDYMHPGADGAPRLDFSALTRAQAAALVEVTVDEYVVGTGDEAAPVRRVKFKLADKRAALVDIGRHLGMFVDRIALQNPDGSALVEGNTLQAMATLIAATHATIATRQASA